MTFTTTYQAHAKKKGECVFALHNHDISNTAAASLPTAQYEWQHSMNAEGCSEKKPYHGIGIILSYYGKLTAFR